ncbi:MAG TPA: class I SAM-dependent methyltransferase [Sphingomicrobium sp.]|jgi:SAM-dependent methyltransferase|nr:class I SAM-dependent methyltransferase [Sphingomicrobium sp.]
MADTPFPLTPLEQLPLKIDHEAIEAAYLPFLVDGETGDRAWRSDYARRRRRALTRMIRRVLGLGRVARPAGRDTRTSGADRYDVAAGPRRPAAWSWNERRLALDGMAAARLRAPLLAAVIDRLAPKTVLEVGCGNGINLFSLAGHFPEVAFTGIDVVPNGIDVARKLQSGVEMPPQLADYIPLEVADPAAFKRIDFVTGGATALPFADGAFDLVFTVLTVEQLERVRDQALAEIARIARGHVLMLEPFRDANRRGLRRLYALSRNYFRGSIADLARFNLEPVWATDDFPQEAFLGSPLVLARKRGVDKL